MPSSMVYLDHKDSRHMDLRLRPEFGKLLDHLCRFAGMLRDIESQKSSLGVTAYGLSVTTMEEVFLRISEGSNPEPSSITMVSISFFPSLFFILFLYVILSSLPSVCLARIRCGSSTGLQICDESACLMIYKEMGTPEVLFSRRS